MGGNYFSICLVTYSLGDGIRPQRNPVAGSLNVISKCEIIQ